MVHVKVQLWFVRSGFQKKGKNMASGPFLTSNRFESVKNSIGTPNPSIHHRCVIKKPSHRKSFLKITKMGIFVSLFSHTRHNCRKYFDTFIQKHDKTAILLILKVESFESYAATSFCSTMNVMGGRTTAKEKRLRKSNKRILG